MPKEISTSELTSAQKIKIRKLLRTKDENNICFAIELLQTTQKNDTDLKDIFSKRILYQLAGTMDYSICKLVNTAVIIDDSLRTCFTSGLKKRFGDQSIKKQNSLLSAMLLDIDTNLIDTIKDLFGMMKTVGPLSAGGYDQFDASALSTLDRDQASVLAGCCATEIHLNGLAKLPAPIALILSGKSGHYSFDGLTRLEPDTAKHLAKLEGSISINSLPAISNVCVKALGSFRGKLQLEGLRKLGKSAADLLASQSTEVWLNGLTKITTDAATSFNVHRHDLLLDGLPIISEDVANALAQHRGSMYMRGVKTISCDAALAISKLSGHYSLCMSGLVELTDSVGHLALATKLGKYRRDSILAGTPWFLGNSFYNLKSLSEEAAVRLAQGGGKLGFNPALLTKKILRILRDGGCRTSN